MHHEQQLLLWQSGLVLLQAHQAALIKNSPSNQPAGQPASVEQVQFWARSAPLVAVDFTRGLSCSTRPLKGFADLDMHMQDVYGLRHTTHAVRPCGA